MSKRAGLIEDWSSGKKRAGKKRPDDWVSPPGYQPRRDAARQEARVSEQARAHAEPREATQEHLDKKTQPKRGRKPGQEQPASQESEDALPEAKILSLKSGKLVSDEQLVYRLARTHLSVETIASVLGMSPLMLTKQWEGSLERGRADQKVRLVERMWEKALDGDDTQMQIWMSKQHLGYKDKQESQQASVQFNIRLDEVPR